MLGALGGGSWVWFLQWKLAGHKAPSLGCLVEGGHCALSPRTCAELCTSGRSEALNKSCCVPAEPADRAVNAVPASGATQWGHCHECHGIMGEGLSPQHVLCLQQLPGGAGGQLSCADCLRETCSASSFLNVSLNVLSWHIFP